MEDKKIALAAALTYWVFRCRDKGKTPAMGVKTWEYLTSSIKNAAIPAATLEDYIEGLCSKLATTNLRPKELTWILKPNQTIRRINSDGEILEIDADQGKEELIFESWVNLLNSLAPQGITARHILNECRQKPHVIATYVRVRYSEDKALGKEEIEDIEVEASAI